MPALLAAIVCALAAWPSAAEAQARTDAPLRDPIEVAFSRMYDYDFAGAFAVLDAQAAIEPGDPLIYSTRAAAPEDRNALFAMAMSACVVADYTGLVERRQWRFLTLSKETKRYVDKLLALNPPVYDAYYNVGSLEYVVGSLPFFVRWFVPLDTVEGNKRKRIDALKIVARQGRYYGPFARVLLAVVSLRAEGAGRK
jgi:hypothetical protein